MCMCVCLRVYNLFHNFKIFVQFRDMKVFKHRRSRFVDKWIRKFISIYRRILAEMFARDHCANLCSALKIFKILLDFSLGELVFNIVFQRRLDNLYLFK